MCIKMTLSASHVTLFSFQCGKEETFEQYHTFSGKAHDFKQKYC